MSFGAIAADYDRLQAGPPEAAVDWLLPEHGEVAIDVGARSREHEVLLPEAGPFGNIGTARQSPAPPAGARR